MTQMTPTRHQSTCKCGTVYEPRPRRWVIAIISYYCLTLCVGFALLAVHYLLWHSWLILLWSPLGVGCFLALCWILVKRPSFVLTRLCPPCTIEANAKAKTVRKEAASGAGGVIVVGIGVLAYLAFFGSPLVFDVVASQLVSSTVALQKAEKARNVPELISFLSGEFNKENAAVALGRIADRRGTSPLLFVIDRQFHIEHSDQDESLIDAAIEAIVKIGDRQAVPRLRQLFGDHTQTDAIRAKLAAAMFQIDRPSATQELTIFLTNWDCSPLAVKALLSSGWKPNTPQDQVYVDLAQRDGAKLLSNLAQTTAVLLDDLKSTDETRFSNALFAYASLGIQEAIPDLVKALQERGTPSMAVAYLNCGQSDLHAAAVKWAKDHGYEIVTKAKDSRSLAWGSLRGGK